MSARQHTFNQQQHQPAPAGDQPQRLQAGHRRRPPEDAVSLVHHSQHDNALMGLKEPPHLVHAPFNSSSAGDSGVDLGAQEGSIALHTGQQQRGTMFDSCGNSFGGEPKALEAQNSGDSGQSRIAGKNTPQDWFNTFNRDVGGNQSFPNYDNDSPYYMPNVHRKKHQQQGPRQSRPTRSNTGGFPDQSNLQEYRAPTGILDSTEESNSDSFRGVIDDLTIKNQKLKKRLRRLESIHGRNAPGERLFEVRVHGLSESKKTELERLLQSFTASLENDEAAEQGGSSGTSSRTNLTPGIPSSTLDSGYASVSRNGGESLSAQSGGQNIRHTEQMKPWVSSQTNTEISKMRLVVSKLEQLFTGREAIMSDRAHLLEQQGISDMATAEENGSEARQFARQQLKTEGTRGASLMPPVSSEQANQTAASSDDPTVVSMSEPIMENDDDAPEQRPTRPIDLDPQREQVAEENIEYLAHMTGSSSKGPGVEGGWVYLNLIINLAQLHTINVTPPFIKKAIAAASTKLELSPDGKMVRWKGGTESTQFSNTGSSGSGENGDRSSEDAADKARDVRSPSGDGSGSSGQPLQSLESGGKNRRFHYKPLFARSQSFEDDSSSFTTSTDTDSPDMAKRSSSGGSGSGSKRDTGPIIFYKGGAYCTDLSSQPLREEESGNEGLPRYIRATTRPLGLKSHDAELSSTRTNSPLYQAGISGSLADDSMHIDSDSSSSIEFSPRFTATKPPSSPPSPIMFEASGIGGVLPADNFAIHCQTKHYILPDHQSRLPVSRSRALKSRLHKRILHRIPKASIDAFHDPGNMTDSSVGSTVSTSSQKSRPSKKRPLRHELLSANTHKLPPSSLPPASYIFASPSEESSSYGETDEDVGPRSSGSEDYFFHQAIDGYRASSGEENDSALALYQRSPSSVATAGDGSQSSSLDIDAGLEINVEDGNFEGPLSMDDSADSSSGGLGGSSGSSDSLNSHRPNLKRSRGSVISTTSNTQVRKSARMLNDDYS